MCHPQVLQKNKLPWNNRFPFQKGWKAGRAQFKDSYQDFVSKTTGLFEGEEGKDLVLVEDLGSFGVKEMTGVKGLSTFSPSSTLPQT